MPVYEDIQKVVREKHGFSTQPCWISECKAIAMKLPDPHLNRDGSLRKKQQKQPMTKAQKIAILKVFEEFGIPDGKRVFPKEVTRI